METNDEIYMIESFINWFERNELKLKEKKVSIITQKNMKDNSLSFFTSVSAEFKTRKAIGVVILYHTGYLDFHVLDPNKSDDDVIFIEGHKVKNENDLFNILRKTFKKIISL